MRLNVDEKKSSFKKTIFLLSGATCGNCLLSFGRGCLAFGLYPDRRIQIKVRDKGCGIPDIQRAMEPMYTSVPEEERAGLGFAVMQSLMDRVRPAVPQTPRLPYEKMIRSPTALQIAASLC